MSRHFGPILRSIISVIAGYVVLAFTNMAFVMLFFVNPIVPWGPIPTALLSLPFTFVCSLVAGYLSSRIAGRSEMKHVVSLAGLMGLVIVVSMIMAVAVEPLWYKIIYLVIMAPATLLGGHLRKQPVSNSHPTAASSDA